MSAATVGDQVVQYQNLRAGPSIIISLARFVNLTDRDVDVLWINFQGAPLNYSTLQPKSWIDVNTFVGHCWVFRDSVSGQPLICLPQKSHVFLPEAPPDGVRRRKLIKISIPVFSLQSRCLQVLAVGLSQNSKSVDSLDLPLSLTNCLRAVIDEGETYRSRRVSVDADGNIPG